MLRHRVIARLDIKGNNVVKGIHMEGLRVIGDPVELALKYYEQNAHELLYIDTVASLYGRNQLEELIRRTSDEIYIPITVGGGITGTETSRSLFNAGADKVAINTHAIRKPEIINNLAEILGSQALTVSIQAKKMGSGWEALIDGGRERTGIGVSEWVKNVYERGAGEILLTSIDQDGTMAGFDLELINSITIDVPLIACGGLGCVQDAIDAIDAGADAVCCGSALHYNKLTIGEIDDGINKEQFQDKKTCAA